MTVEEQIDGWEGESCQRCMTPYDYVWHVPSHLWEQVTGYKDGEGLRCIPCFIVEAQAKHIDVWFLGEEGKYPQHWERVEKTRAALKAAFDLVTDCVPDDLIEKPDYLLQFDDALKELRDK